MMNVYAEALSALEHSGLGHLARHSAYTFTFANVLHVLGAALLVGAIAVFDTALVARRFEDGEDRSYRHPGGGGGLALQVPTGLVLLAAEAQALGINPAFYAKILFITVGLLNVALFHAWFEPPSRRARPSGSADTGARLARRLGPRPRGRSDDRAF